MVTLPEQLPLELRSSLKQGEDSKGGYFLHYGFLARPERLQDCVSKLKLDCTGRGPSAALSAIAKEIARRSEGTLEPWLQLCDRLPVPDRDERLGPDRVIALYSNGNIGIGSNGMPYTPKEKADYIQLLGDILSPSTDQKEPMWYWDHSHA
ncbi:hypothetical protein TRAPUB_9359 [Trametes pubescens]|uniref:Uncharacterized protein n=1 Tax=Trametes pubescens TaxID=154538 RepID=A0A1M2W2Q8_TRAPU|nr:hypothetical protein TRAPUB_9359 [Trametes pubescens]